MARGLLIVVPSLVATLGLWDAQASVVGTHGLGCPETCGIFPDQGSNYIDRRILNYWTSREAQPGILYFYLLKIL